MADDIRQRIDDLVERGLLDQWYAVAKSVQVKTGRPHAVKALGRNLVLWRDRGGQLKCLEDYCPHRGAPLSRGEVLGDDIACRYHGVRLDGTGTIVRVPAMPDCALEGRRPVESFAVAEFERRDLRLFRRDTSKQAAAAGAARRVHRSAMDVDPVRFAVVLQLPLCARQSRRSHARIVPARQLVHARVRRQAGPDAHRAHRPAASSSPASSSRARTSTGPRW